MGKYLKSFQTMSDFDSGKSQLTRPWVVYIFDKNDGESNVVDEVKYRVTKVKDCLNEGYFELTSKTIKPITTLGYNISEISDFSKVFFGNIGLSGETVTDAPYVFVSGDNTILSDTQKRQIINLLNKSSLRRNLSDINLQYFNLPDKDVVITRYGRDSYHDYDAHGDLMSNSTFNNVKIVNKRGNVSSFNAMFRRANMKSLEFVKDGGIFKPTDISGMVEFCYDLASFPNTIDYSNCPNIGYAWECCYALPEIPSYYTVTDETSRLSTPENIMGGRSGIAWANQTFNQCLNLQKIGPVLDLRKLNPNASDSNGTMPYLMFNNCYKLSDVRLKNLSNGNWNFASGIYNMDIDSIKYAIENVAYQPEHTWTNIAPSTVNGVTVYFNPSSTVLMFLYPMSTTHLRDYYAPKATQFKANVPTGYVMKMYAYDANFKYLNEVLTVTGNGSEQSVSFANTSAVYGYITLAKTNNAAITPAETSGLTITLSVYNKENNAWTGNIIPSNTHTLSFSGRYADKISNKTLIPASTIQTANDKGWRIYTDNIEVTPTSKQLNVNYRFKLSDWEINTALGNDVEVTDTCVIVKKFRPNVWFMRSATAMNNGPLSTTFGNLYMSIKGIAQYASNIFSYRFYSNGCVGGDGGTKGSICGLGILPFSLHGTPTAAKSPELPFSAYVWDGPGNETTAWRGDWGCGYNGYGYRNDHGKKLVYPNQTSFPTPYESHKLAMGLYTGNIHTFDRWYADNATLTGYLNFQTPFKVTICGRRETGSTLTSKMLATQEVFENVKFKFTNMQEGDYFKWSHTTSKIVDASGNTVTAITQDGIYTISNTGLDGGFILYGNNALTGTNPVTIEIIDNPSYIDENGLIDISNNPIVIELLYDSITENDN